MAQEGPQAMAGVPAAGAARCRYTRRDDPRHFRVRPAARGCAVNGLPDPGERRRLTIDGEAGDIECALSAPRGREPVGALLVCHPHPLYGGTMDNKVVTTLAAAAHDAGMAAMRFNFRGVGGSGGAHDEGRGEARDCVLLAQWLREQLGDRPLALAGFSFGGFVALAAQAVIAPAALITVAPAVAYFGEQGVPAWPRMPWLCIHARDDDVVSLEENRARLASADSAPRWEIPEQAGHFFHGRLELVRDPARALLETLSAA